MSADADLLLQRLRWAGAAADAVRAWTGMYPTAGGYTNWGTLFTRHRILALCGESIEFWSAYTGPSPVKRLWSAPSASLRPADKVWRSAHEKPDAYAQFICDGRRVWVASSDAEAVLGWLGP